MDERNGTITKVLFIQEGSIAPKAPITIMIYVDEGNNLNTTILQLKKEKEEMEEKFYHTTCEKN